MFADLKFRLRALFRRVALERELDDELRFHLEREIEKHMRAGATRAEAERRAKLEFGGVEQIKDDTRRVRGVGWIDAGRRDVRYAWRVLMAKPGFTGAVVLTLGLGVAANTVMFGIVDRLLIRSPAHLAAATRVHRVQLSSVVNGQAVTQRNQPYRRYLDLTQQTTSFEAAAAFAHRGAAVGTGAETSEQLVAAVSASFFEFFDAEPVLGRFYTVRDDQLPAGERVVVLGYGFWQSAFGGRRSVLGETLQIGTSDYTVIGVAPRHFVGLAARMAPALFMPITAYGHDREADFATDYGWSWLEVLLRRKPDVTAATASLELTRAWERSWEAQRAEGGGLPPAAAAQLNAQLGALQWARVPGTGPDGKIVAWVMGVAMIVLLIACANVSNLLLSRALDRRRELSLRLALGATHAQLWRQLATETALLALLGGTVGLAVAQWGGDTIRALFLREADVGAVATDGRTLLFTVVITLLLALLTALAPGLQALRAEATGMRLALSRDRRGRHSHVRTGLLVFQAALSVVLLVGAGLFGRSLTNVRSYRLGYDLPSLVYIEGNMRGLQLSQPERNALADRLLEAAVSTPGVRSATLIESVPFGRTRDRGAPTVEGVDSLEHLGAFTLQAGSPTYFATTGTRVLRGRGFSARDDATSPPVVVINQAMADAIWPGQDAIGRRLRIDDEAKPSLTVIGIAENMSGRHFGGEPEFWYYLPVAQYRAQYSASSPDLLVRVDGDAEDHVQQLRARLQRELPAPAYVNARALHELVAPHRRGWEFGATMFAAFAALAIVLAAIGLYSIIAYAVAQRMRELGVRIALGASAGAILQMIVRQGIVFAVAGIVLGSAVALFAAPWIEPLLFNTGARDPLVYAVVAGILLLVSLAATVGPALRATRVDPLSILRAE